MIKASSVSVIDGTSLVGTALKRRERSTHRWKRVFGEHLEMFYVIEQFPILVCAITYRRHAALSYVSCCHFVSHLYS